jgi:decaprenylphospho-beta-D-erythro-pentofuranosid-2-ulose 2-reductase
MNMKVVLLGGTSGMGRALGRLLMERGHDVFLAGIDEAELRKSAQDFEQRGGGKRKVSFAECDLLRPETFQPALDQAHAALSGFDTVVVTAGLFGTQERLEQDTEFTRVLLTANFTNTVVFCELARKYLLGRGGGILCAFSSVAGDRGRKPVVLYGASKAGLSAYLEGLDHRYRTAGLRTITVKPGFVRTSMTEGLKAPPFAGEPEGVAHQVITAMERGTPVVYAPAIWAWVMRVIRNLPRFVMRRVQF